MKARLAIQALGLALVVAVGGPMAQAAAGAAPDGKRALSDLKAQAQKEGRLVTLVGGSEASAIPKLVSAFKARFGLDINVKIDTGSPSGTHVKTVGEMQVGVRPSYDALVLGPDTYMMDLYKVGGYARVDHWQLLLSEINPLVRKGAVRPEIISPPPFSGYAFIHANRSKSLVYNKKLIAEGQVPKTRVAMADPAYRGKYAVPPWINAEEYGVLLYSGKELEKWLDIMDQIGKGAKFVATFNQAFNRLLLGEIAFMSTNSYLYWQALAKDPGAPIGIKFWEDFTAVTNAFAGVMKGSRHPAAATLFVLWMTTPEAHALLQEANFLPNLLYGSTELDRTISSAIKRSGSQVLNWFNPPENIEKLRWLTEGKEGQEFSEKLLRAQTQRKK